MTAAPDVTHLSVLLDELSEATFTLDSDWRFTYLNRQAIRLFGHVEDHVGRNALEVWPALKSLTEQNLLHNHSGGEPRLLELHGPHDDARYELRVISFGTPSRPLLGVQARDVSEQYAARQEGARLREIVAASPSCIKVLDLEGRLLSMNAGGLKTMEIADFSSCQNLLWPTFWAGAGREMVEAAIAAARNGETTTFEGEASTFAGTPKWWEVTVSPLRNEDGVVGQLLAVSRDITARYRAETRFQQGERRWRRLVEASPVGIAVGRPDGHLVQVNDAYIRLLGFTRAEYEAGEIDWAALTPPEYRADDRAALEQVLAEGGPVSYGKETLTSSGERLPVGVVLIRDEAIHDGQNQPFVLGYMQDLSPFRAAERVLLEHSETLGRQVQERTTELEERNAALDAFVSFTEVSAQTTDATALAGHVRDVLQATLGSVSVGYSELEDGLWKGRMMSDDVPQAMQEASRNGFPADLPSFARPFREGEVVFVDGWEAAAEQVEASEIYTATAFYPYSRQGQPFGLLTIALSSSPAWSERQRRIFRSVGLSLQLALERTEVSRQLSIQNAELEIRTRALDSFANLTRDLSLHAEPHTLVRRAQEVVLSLLPSGYTLYYELQGSQWRNTVQTGDVGNDGLQSFIDTGPPVGETPSIDLPWNTKTPLYQDEYAKGSDTEAQLVEHVNAAATLPVLVHGESVGVFVACMFQARPWKGAEKAVMETVVYSLGLALERAEQARQLEEERASLEAFTTYTEAVGSELDVSVLIQRAVALLQETRTVDVTYFERERAASAEGPEAKGQPDAEVFRVKTWPDHLPADLLARCQDGFSPQQKSFAQAAGERRAVFFNDWDAEDQGVPESAIYGAVALQPFFQGQALSSVLVMACRDRKKWSKRDRGIFRAVGRSLNLALERADSVSVLAHRSHELERSNTALAAANEELEAFAYSASHDLRTPVRHVLAFADLAGKALVSTPNEKVSSYLAVVHQAGVRMTALIDAMLLLSRAGRQDFTPRMVDLNALVTQARRDVGAEFVGRPIRWTGTEPFPHVWGDLGMLQQVLTNLLSNAVKYSGTRAVSEVDIRAETRGHEWLISVRDNGVGFNPQYAQKLFGVFQRLHSDREFEGTGIGLATVRRIVLKHGGQVFAESTGDEGATFGFTLPRPLASESQR